MVGRSRRQEEESKGYCREGYGWIVSKCGLESCVCSGRAVCCLGWRGCFPSFDSASNYSQTAATTAALAAETARRRGHCLCASARPTPPPA